MLGLSTAFFIVVCIQRHDCFMVRSYDRNGRAASACTSDYCSRTLPISMSSKDSQVEDDGYSVHKSGSFFKLLSKMNPLNNPEPGTLILVRHGQTTLNYNKTFTGWIDVDLSENGKREVEHAARLLLERGYTVDVTYTSRLKRAIRSSWIILKELGETDRCKYLSWRHDSMMSYVVFRWVSGIRRAYCRLYSLLMIMTLMNCRSNLPTSIQELPTERTHVRRLRRQKQSADLH